MRLNVYVAKSLGLSRRRADTFIKDGKVEVNGDIITNPGFTVGDAHRVKVKSREISPSKHIYVIFNKPKGVTTTRSSVFKDKNIFYFLPRRFKKLFPVGRLDKNSTGLLILTNDGQLCYKVTHPRFEVEKEYLVKITGTINKSHIIKARDGLVDAGDILKVKKIHIEGKGLSDTLLKVIVTEGKKRHLRRLFKKLGRPVISLKRTRISRLALGNLKEGNYKILQREEIYALLKLGGGAVSPAV
ncbi:MAG: pseudouridine synthase [Candidatus Omnitrophota bacterium]